MPITFTPTSELEAINTMLTAIGEAPVNSMDDQLITDVSIARNILHEVSRDLQTSDWWFNTEEDFELSLNGNGEISLPGNILRADYKNPWRSDIKPVQRGSRMYDAKNHTYKFNENLKVNVVLFLPFNQLPEPARRFITIKSSRVFQDRVLGSEAVHAYTARDEQFAWAKLKEAEADVGHYNLMHNTMTRRILRR